MTPFFLHCFPLCTRADTELHGTIRWFWLDFKVNYDREEFFHCFYVFKVGIFYFFFNEYNLFKCFDFHPMCIRKP